MKPLTILLGPNSSGKSSLIAPLLLLKQSMESQTGRTALLTRGRYVNAGAFQDFAHDHDPSAQVKFGLRWHSHRQAQAKRPVGQYPPGGLEVGITEGDDVHQVRLSSYLVEDTYRRPLLRRQLQEDGRYSLNMPRVPQSARRRGSAGANTKASRAMRAAARDARPVDFLFTSTSVRQASAESADAHAPAFPTGLEDDRMRFYCQIVDLVQWSVEDVTENLYFLGPLREPPRRVYELSGEMPPDVGTRGEYAPEILYRWRNDAERLGSVERWLRHFGLEDTIRFEAVGSEGFALNFGSVRRSTNSVLDLGFGLSQLLPLIVQGLLASTERWLVVEQPEIHLNPRLQAALADLFADFVGHGLGLIVETHSEHLLLRIRRLLAEEVLQARDVALFFVERHGTNSIVTEVPLDQSGYISPERWPTGFFDDSLRESLALAQAQSARSTTRP